MFKKKYLLLELDQFEAEFYHLPDFVPYFEKDQKKLETEGFNWQAALNAMKQLLKEDNCEEYKLYKLYSRKWDHYQRLTVALDMQNWIDAQKIIDKILAIDLLDPSAYYNKAFVFRELKDYKSAEQSYYNGLELVTIQAPFHAGLAKTYEDLGKTEDAIYFWNLALEEIAKKDLVKTSNNPIFSSIYREAQQRLIDFDVYRIKEENNESKSFIEFAKANSRSQAIYEQEMPPSIGQELPLETKTIASLTKLSPGSFYERLMRKSFEKNFNNVDKLNELGISLVHNQLTALAVRVFERVYQLSQFARQAA